MSRGIRRATGRVPGSEWILSSKFTAVHAIHIEEAEIARLARHRATYALVQRLNAIWATAFWRPINCRPLGSGFAWVQTAMFRSIPWKTHGTSSTTYDSRSVNVRFLRPPPIEKSLAGRLFQAATENGAASIGASGGSLEVGRPAHFFTVDLNDISIAGPLRVAAESCCLRAAADGHPWSFRRRKADD